MTQDYTVAAVPGKEPAATVQNLRCVIILDISAESIARALGGRRSSSGWMAECPAHDDSKPSLAIAEGNDGKLLVHCYAGCTQEAVLVALRTRGLWHGSPPPLARRGAGRPPQSHLTVAEAVASLEGKHGPVADKWFYQNSAGADVGAVLRWNKSDGDKDIRPLSRHGVGWQCKAMAAPRPLYGLPEVLRSTGRVYVVEGEKCADALATLGFTVTTSAGGSNAAKHTNWHPLAGRDIAILPDNDAPGQKYAADVVALLRKLERPALVRVVELPNLPEGGDIVDYIARRRAEGADDTTIQAEIEVLVEVTPAVETQNAGPRAISVCLADVEPEPIEWLWERRIPIGKLTLLQGDPKLGKSLVTLDIAARVTRGTAWPDEKSRAREPGSVVVLSAEDDVKDTILPRFIAADGDRSKMHAIQAVEQNGERKSFSLADDLAVLEAELDKHPDCKLIIIDPISAYLGDPGKVNSHRNTDVRAVLAPLVELAARRGVAVVGVTHMTKSDDKKAIYRAMGSLAFVAAARAIWQISADPDDAGRRLMLPVGMNLAKERTGLAYRIITTQGSVGEVGVVGWEDGEVNISANDALAAEGPRRRRGPEPVERREAVEWLARRLSDGPVPASIVHNEADARGFSEATLRRAKKCCEVQTGREGFGKGSQSIWKLPSIDAHVPAPVSCSNTADGKTWACMEEPEHACENTEETVDLQGFKRAGRPYRP